MIWQIKRIVKLMTGNYRICATKFTLIIGFEQWELAGHVDKSAWTPIRNIDVILHPEISGKFHTLPVEIHMFFLMWLGHKHTRTCHLSKCSSNQCSNHIPMISEIYPHHIPFCPHPRSKWLQQSGLKLSLLQSSRCLDDLSHLNISWWLQKMIDPDECLKWL